MPSDRTEPFASPAPLDDKYELGDELGRGGVGRVQRAKDRILGRDVAVKFLHERHLDDSSIRERFVEEAQIGGQLQHPGVVPVYDLGRHGEELFFSMKLVEGETLATQLERRESPRDEPRRFLTVFEDICQAVAFAHARGVIHRDLKPENVMIGAFGEVQVVDWGLGKILGSSSPDISSAPATTRDQSSTLRTARSESEGLRSEAGTTIGTPAYMPREQALGEIARTDTRSDVFSLGAILCEILTGAPPYTGSPDEVIVQAAMARLDDAHARLAASGAEPAMVQLAVECLQADPDARPLDARVLAERTRAHLEQAERRLQDARVAAARSEVQAKALRRMIGLGAALLLVFACGLATSLWYWNAAEEASEQERLARVAVDRELSRSEEIRRLVTAMLDQVTPERAQTADTELLQGVLDETAAQLQSGRISDPVVAGELHFLVGRVYKSIGNYDLAKVHLRQSADRLEQGLGESSPQTMGALLVLSEVLWRSGQQDEGEQLHIRLERDFERLLGPDDPNTLTVKMHRALAAGLSGRFAEAEERLTAIRDSVRSVFGPEHEYWALMQSAMADVFAQTDRLELAQQVGERALASQLARHGETHPDVLAIRSNLAQVRLMRGDAPGAISTLEDCARLDVKVFGPRHPSTLTTLGMLTQAYEENGQLDRALTTADTVIERGDLEDETGPALLSSMHDRMLILKKLGRLPEAIRQGEALSQGLLERNGEAHEDTLAARTDFGGVLLTRGETDEAIAVLAPNFEGCLNVLGPAHQFTQVCFEFLVDAYLASDRRPEAEKLVRKFRRQLLDDPKAPPQLLIDGTTGLLAEPAPTAEELSRAVRYAQRAADALEGESKKRALALKAEAQKRLTSKSSGR